MHELELKMAQLAVDEATVELEKFRQDVAVAKEKADPREMTRVKLEVNRAAIRVQMRKVRCDMVRLQIALAKAVLAHMRTGLKENPRANQ